MTTAAAKFLARVRGRMRGVQSDVQSAYLSSLKTLLDSLPAGQLETLIAEGRTDALLSSLFSSDNINEAFSRFRTVVQGGVQDGVMYFARDVPGVVGKASLGIVFGVINPQTVDAIRTVDTKVMSRLAGQVQDSVRAIIEQGYTDGVGPRTTASALRQLIGLSPAEQAQVNNFRDALLGINGRDWQDYARRDRRFDSTIQRAMDSGNGLSTAQVDRMADAYTRRRVALSAEANARTATLDAYKLAQQASWQTAIDRGIVDGDSLFKEWIGVNDSRERPEHVEMNGEVVPFSDPFSNGQMTPGEADWNCRCWARVFARLGRSRDTEE